MLVCTAAPPYTLTPRCNRAQCATHVKYISVQRKCRRVLGRAPPRVDTERTPTIRTHSSTSANMQPILRAPALAKRRPRLKACSTGPVWFICLRLCAAVHRLGRNQLRPNLALSNERLDGPNKLFGEARQHPRAPLSCRKARESTSGSYKTAKPEQGSRRPPVTTRRNADAQVCACTLTPAMETQPYTSTCRLNKDPGQRLQDLPETQRSTRARALACRRLQCAHERATQSTPELAHALSGVCDVSSLCYAARATVQLLRSMPARKTDHLSHKRPERGLGTTVGHVPLRACPSRMRLSPPASLCAACRHGRLSRDRAASQALVATTHGSPVEKRSILLGFRSLLHVPVRFSV